jgi:hypothetical protein
MKLSLPTVSLEKLYRYHISKGVGFSKKALKDYSKAAEVLLVGLEGKLSPEEFKAKITSRILNELGVRKALSNLLEKGLPIDSQSLMQALSKTGVETNKTTVETLLSLLKKAGVLWFKKTPIVAESLTEQVYAFVLSKIGRKKPVTYRELEPYFPNARYIVLQLVSEGRLGIRHRKAVLEHLKPGDWDNYQEDIPDVFLESWIAPDKSRKKRIAIPGGAIIYVLLD